ncbi:MAG: hypothetical protein C5B44_06575 [Acidobacteria bacterium]|nr:MAG: hypothetical protein C5B44_06575 [Acidobacteriota bacterium]
MTQWLKQLIASWTWHDLLMAGLVFLITFGASLAIVAFILVKLPANYFSKSSDRRIFADLPRGVRIAAIVAKNALGVILLLLGIILSIPGVPGQGILTILLGIMLLDFPGRHRLEQKILCRPKVREAIDSMRRKFGKPPLILE